MQDKTNEGAVEKTAQGAGEGMKRCFSYLIAVREVSKRSARIGSNTLEYYDAARL